MTSERMRYLASCRHRSAATEMLATAAFATAASRVAAKPFTAPIAPHNLAAYLAATNAGVGIKVLARIGRRNAAGVRRALARIENRRDDPAFDRYLEALA